MFLAHGNVQDLSVSFARRRPRLVIDPLLCLSDAGIHLIRRLEQVAELWLPRELWHILDNSRYFMARPDALFARQALPEGQDYRRALFARSTAEVESEPDLGRPTAQDVRRALLAWEALRLSRDLTSLSLFWLGDGLSESFLPEGARDDLHTRFEALAEWLDAQLQPASPLALAQRDALALALALDGAPILALVETNHPHAPLRELAAPVRLHAVAEGDPLAELEASSLREGLVRAGCPALIWAGLKLAVAHAAAAFEPAEPDGLAPDEQSADLTSDASSAGAIDLFWYGL